MKIKVILTPAELSATKSAVHFIKSKVNTLKNAFQVVAGKFGKTTHAREFETIRNEAVFDIKENEVGGNYEVEFSFAETYTIRSIDLYSRIFDTYVGLFEAVVPAFAMFFVKMFPLMEEMDSMNREAVRVRPTTYSNGATIPVAHRAEIDFTKSTNSAHFIDQYEGQDLMMYPDLVDSISLNHKVDDTTISVRVELGNNILEGSMDRSAFSLIDDKPKYAFRLSKVIDPRDKDLTRMTVERIVGSGAAYYAFSEFE